MQPPDDPPTAWQRLLALSGVVFAVLMVVGWFISGGNAPDYTAADQDWTTWADDNQWKSRVGGFLILLAGFVFLHFAATIRSVLASCSEPRTVAYMSRRLAEGKSKPEIFRCLKRYVARDRSPRIPAVPDRLDRITC